MIPKAIVFSAVILTSAAVARAQVVAVEADQTIGVSTDGTTGVATQVRTFGDAGAGIRFNIEGAWAAKSTDDSDAFGGAYPYGNRVTLIEAYGERVFMPGRALVVVRAGRYRPPFGISSGSDHAYMGFLRAPLIRYDDYYGLANTFLEHGVDVVVGTPRLSLETSLGVPADVGNARRATGLDEVARGQAAFGSFVIGISHIRSKPYLPATFAHGQMAFTGVDLRWMRDGVQLRGEWIVGQPFDGTTTRGGYVDLILHRPVMGPVTAVARAEHLAYDAIEPFAMYAARYTAGARVRVLNQVALQVEIVRQTGALSAPSSVALDAGLTLSLRHDTGR